jgi:ribonucleoside-triphosphate reductase
MDNIASDTLSQVTTYMKYAKYLPEQKRRETWSEIVDRNKAMFIKKFPQLEEEINEAYKLVYEKKVMPSMRSLQFAGKPIEINNTRLYNCSALPVDDIRAFSETMFLLLSGTGVGYSVQKHHIKKLPPIVGPIRADGKDNKKKRYLIGDSIEGWSDAIKVLVESYFKGEREIDFDYRDIRPKGAHLITSGGKAPGPQPLKDCIHDITKVLDNAIADRGINAKLTTLEAHDIMCFIADAVLSGGIRRAAMISLFSFEDTDMLNCKSGNWFELNPQRARANNSVVLVRSRISKEDFLYIWERIKASHAGEPGIFFTNDKDMLCNPCAEAGLKPFEFCNLTSIVALGIIDQADLNDRARCAAFIGTLQASFTNFHYLRQEWQDQTEKDALIGVNLTGIATQSVLDLDLTEAAKVITAENERVAKLIGIAKAARCTMSKPDGTSALVCGTSSGVHAWYNDYYFRRIRINKEEPIYKYLAKNLPSLVEDDFFKPAIEGVLTMPMKAPVGAKLRSESALDTLERVKDLYTRWIAPGHRKGPNKHSVSCTINIKDEEWDSVFDWMWENRECYAGISVLPYDNASYVQTPFSDCTKEQYEELLSRVVNIDLSKIKEESDNTKLQEEVSCGGGSCQISKL